MPPIHRQQSRGGKCGALHEDGSTCQEKLLQPRHTLCQYHHQEHKRLYESYKLQEKHYNRINIDEGGADIREKIEAKLAAGKEILNLRNQVNRRFFNISAQNRGHIQRILMLQSKLGDLQQRLAALHAEDATSSTAENSQDTGTGAYRPLLDPVVPAPTLSHPPSDSPISIVKQAANEILARMVDELYSISPSLNDSSSVVLDDETHEMREPDERDLVVRFLFREFLLTEVDADMLASARRTESIDAFLRSHSSIEFLEDCLRFFTNFYAGCGCKLYLLRNAVYDYLLDPGVVSITILGARIATEDSPRRMTAKGWDVLYVNFNEIVGWWNLDYFAFKFDDIVLVKTLTAIHRYGSEDSDDGLSWLLPGQDVSQENNLAVMHGFIAVRKGGFDTDKASNETRHDATKETQTRAYLVGRMAKDDAWALRLAQELNERITQLLVLVRHREDAFGTTPLISLPKEDPNPWIKRTRLTLAKEVPNSEEWIVESSVVDILDDLEMINDPAIIARDYYEFIIIERGPNREFSLIDMVSEALSVLKGDLLAEEAQRHATRISVPAELIVGYTRAMNEIQNQIQLDENIPLASHQYENSRVRCWDVPESVKGIVRATLRNLRVISRRQSRLISRMSEDLESRGIITRVRDYQRPCVQPIIIKGVDGFDDFYFQYDLGPIYDEKIRGSPLDPKHSKNNLLKFCDEYKLTHPGAIFAKGSIDVHYCAWPMPMLDKPKYAHINFCTPEGRLYKWEALPFDMPLSTNIWQHYVNYHINDKLPFVRLVQTTLVICAEDRDRAHANIDTLCELGDKHGWSFNIPIPALWTTNARNIGLGFLRRGVDPAV